MPNPNAEIANKSLARSLENLLVAKNRRLTEDLTKLRVSFEELSAEHASSSGALEALQSDLARQKALNEKLENDLVSVNRDDRSGSHTPSAAGLAGLDIGKPDGRSTPVTAVNGDTSILPIVTSQRDRFRQRNAELEEELRRQFEAISDLRAEVKSLQADNLKLYEKVRYTQSYRESAVAGPSGTSGMGSSGLNGMGIGVSRREDGIGKYKDKYEESMNPFEAFKGRVSHACLCLWSSANRVGSAARHPGAQSA